MKEFNLSADAEKIFDRHWEAAQKEIYKLETLQNYPDDEAELLQLFRENRIEEIKAKYREIINADDTIKQIKKFKRVHLIKTPLTEYIQFENVIYQVWEEFGAEVLFVNENSVPRAVFRLCTDFVLFDDVAVIVNNYNSEGHYTYSAYYNEPLIIKRYTEAKAALNKISIPRKLFLKKEG